MGDTPQPGRVHLDIYVTGRIYGNTVPDTRPEMEGKIHCMDTFIELDEGTFELHNPEKDSLREMRRMHVLSMRNGHCPPVEWRVTHIRNQDALKKTLDKACMNIMKAI